MLVCDFIGLFSRTASARIAARIRSLNMRMQLEKLLEQTEHSVFLTIEEYSRWRKQLPIIGRFLESQSTQGRSVLIGEILANCVDISAPGNEVQLKKTLLALREVLPDGRGGVHAPEPVLLSTHVFEMIMQFRCRHSTIWALINASANKLTGLELDNVQFYPLPHGLIVCRRHIGSLDVKGIAAIGNCLIRDEHFEISQNINLTAVATRLTVEQILMSLLESWRLGHERARKHLCVAVRDFIDHSMKH